MAEMNNFEDFQENFNYITEAIDSIRAQNVMNSGNFDKVLLNISSQLEKLSDEESNDLIKIFLTEVKRSLDEKHDFVASKFSEIENSFNDLVKRSESQLQGHEIKELFEVIAKNMNTFSTDFSSQNDLISKIGLQIEELKQDESQTKTVLKNISSLKLEVEKFGNGFESIIINLNDNFKEVSLVLAKLDPSEALASLKKDIENIFMSSSAVLSALQVIDRKNMEFEDVLNHLVTKEDFNIEQDHVAKLIAQNIQITNYLNELPTKDQFDELANKIDTTVGIINALKNMLGETGEQNQKILSAQLDSLEKKILNISTEDEFIGFRKELSEFAKEVIQSTNLMRGDLADTNYELKKLLDYLDAMDIKTTFKNFSSLTKTSENNINQSISKLSDFVSGEISKNKNITKDDIQEGVSQVNTTIDLAKQEITESSKLNLTNIVEHIQSVINNIFSVKNALHIENMENAEAIDTKLQDLKDDLTNSGNFIVQSSQENLENIISNVEKVFNEIVTVKENLNETSSSQSSSINGRLDDLSKKIEGIRSELNQNSKENFDNISSIVDDFSEQVETMKIALQQSSQGNIDEIDKAARSVVENLSSKISSLKEFLSQDSDVNFSDIKGLIEDLTQTTQSAKANLEQNSNSKFSGLKSDIDGLSQELKTVQENFDIRSQSNLSKILVLFEDLSKEFESHKEFLSQSTQVNFETLSSYINNLNLKIDETKSDYSEDLKAGFSDLQSSIAVLPEVIKENQTVFENEKMTLIEENSKNINAIGDKIQDLIKSLVAKENPFKGEVLYEFSLIKANLEDFKEELKQSNHGLEENVENQVSTLIKEIEESIAKYDEKHDLALLSLQNKIVEYFEAIQNAGQESDLKLDNSIREIYGIKPEIESIIESLSTLTDDSRLDELSGNINKKFEGILLNITQCEELASAKSKDSLKEVLSTLENRFDTVSDDLKAYQSLSTEEINEIIKELEEKVETVKSQINLVNTDVLAALTEKTNELVEWLSPISNEVSKIAAINLDDIVFDIKSKIDSSHYSITSVIRGDIKQENTELLEKFAQNFENLSENLNELILKTSSEQTDEVKELKHIIDGFAQNLEDVSTNTKENSNDSKNLIEKLDNVENLVSDVKSTNSASMESLNSLLQTVLVKIRELNPSSTSVENIVSEAKDEVLEKIDTVQDQLLQTQENLKIAVLNKIFETQNITKTAILDEVIQSQDASKLAILNKILETQDTSKTALLEEFLQAQDETKEAILTKILETQHDTKTGLLNELLQAQDETRTTILSKILQSHEDTKLAFLNQLEQDIASLKEGYYLSTQSLISRTMNESSEQVFEKLDEFNSKLVETQDDSKSSILTKIVDTQNESKSAILEELREHINFFKENLSSFNLDEHFIEEFSQKIKNLQTTFQLVSEEIDQISTSQENYHLSTQSLVSRTMDASNEKVFEKLEEIHDSLLETEHETEKTILDKILETNDNTKISILYEVLQSQDKAQAVVLDKLLETKEEVKTEILDKLIETQNATKTIIENKIVELQCESKTQILDKIIEVNDESRQLFLNEMQETIASAKESNHISTHSLLSKSLDASSEQIFDKIESLQEKLSDIQDSSKDEIIDRIFEYNSETKAAILDKILETQDESKNEILNKILETQDEIKEAISDKISTTQDDSKDAVLDKILEAQEETKAVILDKLLEANDKTTETILNKITENHDETQASILDKILEVNDATKKILTNKIIESQDDIKAILLEDLKENIDSIKQNLSAFEQSSENSEEISQKIGELQSKLESVSEEITDKISLIEDNYKGSAQSLLSEVKTSFNDKVDDTFDELKSFIEILENKKDIALNIDDLKYELFNKFSEITDNFEASIASISVKKDLDELGKDIEKSTNELFDNLEEKFAASIEHNELIIGINDKSDEINRRIENLKNMVADDILGRFADFELNIDNQRQEFADSLEEIKASIAELKESYVDLSLNSTMEMSSLLVTIQEKVESLESSLKEFDMTSNINNIESKIDNLDFGAKIEELTGKFNELDFDKLIENSKDHTTKELEVINQKLDSFADSFDSGSDSKIGDDVKEIKQIVEQLNKVSDIDETASIREDIQKTLEEFEKKLDKLPSGESPDSNQAAEVKDTLLSFKKELFENIVDIFNQISFVAETEEIKDFVAEQTEEIKAEINSKLGNISNFAETSNIDFDLENIKDFVSEQTEEIKEHLLKLQSGLQANESDEYSYTLQDVESDIAKLRIVLNDIVKTKVEDEIEPLNDFEKNDFDTLNENIMSISTRTNKLLLSSDESSSVLKENLTDFRNIVYQLEERIRNIDTKDMISGVDTKLDNVNNLMLSNVKSNKIFNQSLTYLAQWIDTASENMGSILEKVSEVDEIKSSIVELKNSLPKNANVETILNKISTKFDNQQAKINSLEEKMEQLLEAVGNSEDKPDAKLAKKVDSIDKQLAKLNKGIEKLTSYVDEE